MTIEQGNRELCEKPGICKREKDSPLTNRASKYSPGRYCFESPTSPKGTEEKEKKMMMKMKMKRPKPTCGQFKRVTEPKAGCTELSWAGLGAHSC